MHPILAQTGSKHGRTASRNHGENQWPNVNKMELKVQRGLRTGYFVAQASDEEGAVAAVRKKRGMKHAEITIVRDQPTRRTGLADVERQRSSTRVRVVNGSLARTFGNSSRRGALGKEPNRIARQCDAAMARLASAKTPKA